MHKWLSASTMGVAVIIAPYVGAVTLQEEIRTLLADHPQLAAAGDRVDARKFGEEVAHAPFLPTVIGG